jgi:predicted nucleotidyltransferase
MTVQLAVDTNQVAGFCRRHHIRRLALFGSVLGERFGPDSDVDVLVEFDPGHVPGLISLAGLEIELSAIFGGRDADIRTPEDLSRYFRDEVVERAEVIYAA